jgi:hypothetical protein
MAEESGQPPTESQGPKPGRKAQAPPAVEAAVAPAPTNVLPTATASRTVDITTTDRSVYTVLRVSVDGIQEGDGLIRILTSGVEMYVTPEEAERIYEALGGAAYFLTVPGMTVSSRYRVVRTYISALQRDDQGRCYIFLDGKRYRISDSAYGDVKAAISQ